MDCVFSVGDDWNPLHSFINPVRNKNFTLNFDDEISDGNQYRKRPNATNK
jgi:hypothetical protein